MALDLSETALQLDSMAVSLKNSVSDSNIRSEAASTLLEDFNAKDFEARAVSYTHLTLPTNREV